MSVLSRWVVQVRFRGAEQPHIVLYLTTRSQREKCVRDNNDRDYCVPCVTCECDRKVLLVVTRVISAIRVRGALVHHIKGAVC